MRECQVNYDPVSVLLKRSCERCYSSSVVERLVCCALRLIIPRGVIQKCEMSSLFQDFIAKASSEWKEHSLPFSY